jgi:hypothetical protein
VRALAADPGTGVILLVSPSPDPPSRGTYSSLIARDLTYPCTVNPAARAPQQPVKIGLPRPSFTALSAFSSNTVLGTRTSADTIGRFIPKKKVGVNEISL